jgi:N-acetylmuramoyl-L-alanine amidase
MLKIVPTPSPNFDARTTPIDLVVLHYTGMQNGGIALQRLTDPDPRAGAYPMPGATIPDPEQRLGRVSAHYVVAEDGTIHALVDEAARAWHAGSGSWAGRGELNSRAIGIEIVNGGHDFGLPAFPPEQIAALIVLLRAILARQGLGPLALVGHSDVAPTRKADPGERFPWAALAQAGLGLWPRVGRGAGAVGPRLALGESGDAVADLQAGLQTLGYGLPQDGMFGPETQAVVTAFQRRYRPDLCDGVWDGACQARLNSLLDQALPLLMADAAAPLA